MKNKWITQKPGKEFREDESGIFALVQEAGGKEWEWKVGQALGDSTIWVLGGIVGFREAAIESAESGVSMLKLCLPRK